MSSSHGPKRVADRPSEGQELEESKIYTGECGCTWRQSRTQLGSCKCLMPMHASLCVMPGTPEVCLQRVSWTYEGITKCDQCEQQSMDGVESDSPQLRWAKLEMAEGSAYRACRGGLRTNIIQGVNNHACEGGLD